MCTCPDCGVSLIPKVIMKERGRRGKGGGRGGGGGTTSGYRLFFQACLLEEFYTYTGNNLQKF